MNVTKKILGTLLLTLLTSVCSAQELKADAEAPAKKMDVLFIAIDDMNDWTTLFDKNNPIQTPNLERLAARGAFFEKAYCASASCNPSRTATLTGLRPSTSGVYHNPDPWAEMLPNVDHPAAGFQAQRIRRDWGGQDLYPWKSWSRTKGQSLFRCLLQVAACRKVEAPRGQASYELQRLSR